jgi:hypothetical protein
MPIATAPEIIVHIDRMDGIVAVLGAIFPETLVPDVAVHCSPQLKPSGQQLPPRFAGQLYQALGHDPPWGAAVVATLAPLGAAIVTPFELMMVAVVMGAHEPVVWQSRPTLQHPVG